VQVRIEFAQDLSPQYMSAKLRELGSECEAVGVVAAVHPLISQAQVPPLDGAVLSLLDPTVPRQDLIAVLRWLAESPALSPAREVPPSAAMTRSGRSRPGARSKTAAARQPEFTVRPGRQP